MVQLIIQASTFCASGDSYKQKADKGIAEQSNGRCAHAIKIYKEVVAAKPHWYSLYNRIGECFQKLGYSEIARNYFRKTLTYDPDNSQAKSFLEKYLTSQNSEEDLIEISEPPKSGFMSSEEIQAMNQRLWFLRDGLLVTSLRDGSDLREYSQLSMLQIFPKRGGADGFPVLMREKLDAPQGIFYLYPEEGSMMKVSREGYDCHQPIFFSARKELLFLVRSVDKSLTQSMPTDSSSDMGFVYGLHGLNLDGEAHGKTPTRYLSDFYSITEILGGRTDELYFVGRKTAGDRSNVYRWIDGKEPQTVTIGLGNVSGIQLSPDGKRIMALVNHSDGKNSFMVIDLDSGQSSALISSRNDRVSGAWDSDSQHFFMAATDVGINDKWETTVFKINALSFQINKLWKSNFLYKNFVVDEEGRKIYYLSNFDGNYEVYRYNLDTQTQQRLTISSSDETQLGFWTFSGI